MSTCLHTPERDGKIYLYVVTQHCTKKKIAKGAQCKQLTLQMHRAEHLLSIMHSENQQKTSKKEKKMIVYMSTYTRDGKLYLYVVTQHCTNKKIAKGA